jgi:hypothetical protein
MYILIRENNSIKVTTNVDHTFIRESAKVAFNNVLGIFFDILMYYFLMVCKLDLSLNIQPVSVRLFNKTLLTTKK